MEYWPTCGCAPPVAVVVVLVFYPSAQHPVDAHCRDVRVVGHLVLQRTI